MRDCWIRPMVAVLVLSACTGGGPTTLTSPPRSTAPSSARPALDDLVDVRGEPIDGASLEGRIVFSSGTEDIYTINADGSGLQQITSSRALEFDPTWSPDGRAVAYRHQTGDDATTDIFVMGADGSYPRNLTGRDGRGDWGPDWSPDGEWIAWNTSSESRSGFDLGLIRRDGTGRQVIDSREYVEYPAWSPDGRRIAFMSQVADGGSPYDIFVMNADGGEVRRLTRSPGSDGWPAWSPDGRKVVFSSERDDCVYSGAENCLTTGDLGSWHTLYVMDPTGADERRLTRTFGQFAVWSPDGQYILFAPWLNVVRPDGTGLVRIPVQGIPAEPEMPDWTAAAR